MGNATPGRELGQTTKSISRGREPCESPKSSDYRDGVIEAFAASEAALVECLADLAYEHFCLRRAFTRILALADEARLGAQSQCEALWCALHREHEATLNREREAL
jgi:hypothetical protein